MSSSVVEPGRRPLKTRRRPSSGTLTWMIPGVPSEKLATPDAEITFCPPTERLISVPSSADWPLSRAARAASARQETSNKMDMVRSMDFIWSRPEYVQAASRFLTQRLRCRNQLQQRLRAQEVERSPG